MLSPRLIQTAGYAASRHSAVREEADRVGTRNNARELFARAVGAPEERHHRPWRDDHDSGREAPRCRLWTRPAYRRSRGSVAGASGRPDQTAQEDTAETIRWMTSPSLSSRRPSASHRALIGRVAASRTRPREVDDLQMLVPGLYVYHCVTLMVGRAHCQRHVRADTGRVRGRSARRLITSSMSCRARSTPIRPSAGVAARSSASGSVRRAAGLPRLQRFRSAP